MRRIVSGLFVVAAVLAVVTGCSQSSTAPEPTAPVRALVVDSDTSSIIYTTTNGGPDAEPSDTTRRGGPITGGGN